MSKGKKETKKVVKKVVKKTAKKTTSKPIKSPIQATSLGIPEKILDRFMKEIGAEMIVVLSSIKKVPCGDGAKCTGHRATISCKGIEKEALPTLFKDSARRAVNSLEGDSKYDSKDDDKTLRPIDELIAELPEVSDEFIDEGKVLLKRILGRQNIPFDTSHLKAMIEGVNITKTNDLFGGTRKDRVTELIVPVINEIIRREEDKE